MTPLFTPKKGRVGSLLPAQRAPRGAAFRPLAPHAMRAAPRPGPEQPTGRLVHISPLFDGENDPRFWKCIMRVDAFSQRQICQMLAKFGGLVLGCIEAGLSE